MTNAKSISKMPHHGRDRERKTTMALFSAPAFLLYSLFFIVPIISGIYYSMTDWNGITRHFNMVGIQNYLDIFQDDRFRSALWFTLKYSVLLVIFTLVIGLMIAALLKNKVCGQSFFRAAYFFPAVLSMITVGLIFNQIFLRALPSVGQALGIPALSFNILANSQTAMWGVLFVNLWQGLAIPTILLLTGLLTVPEDLYEAAMIDGAGKWQRFLKITVPFLVPTINVVLVLTLKSGIMVFDYIVSMTDGGPGGATESIAKLIYAHAFSENKFAYSIAESIIAGLIICIISAVQIKFSNREE